MALYSIYVPALSTGATAGAFITLVGIKFASTTGHIGRLRRVVIGGGGGAAQDIMVSAKFDRTNNAADGTSTAVATTLILHHNSESIASNVNAIGKNYSAEPTTFVGDQGGLGSFNSRGTLALDFARDEGIKWGITQTLCLLAAPGANTATTLDATITWEE